jgi:hypothetical protein
VAETEITRRDVEASWGDWAAAADLADEPAVALLLLAARDSSQDGPDEREGAAFDEARLELLSGRPDRGLAAPERTGLVDLPAGPAEDPRTALLAACRAGRRRRPGLPLVARGAPQRRVGPELVRRLRRRRGRPGAR